LADKFSRKIAWWQQSKSVFFWLTNFQEKLIGGNAPLSVFYYKFSRKIALVATLPKVAAFLCHVQGCQMVCFQTKIPNLGKFWRVLQWKMLVYFVAIRSILRSFCIFSGHLLLFVVIWYIFPRFGTYLAPRKIWHPWSRACRQRLFICSCQHKKLNFKHVNNFALFVFISNLFS
jgi:hypothetical protein